MTTPQRISTYTRRLVYIYIFLSLLGIVVIVAINQLISYRDLSAAAEEKVIQDSREILEWNVERTINAIDGNWKILYKAEVEEARSEADQLLAMYIYYLASKPNLTALQEQQELVNYANELTRHQTTLAKLRVVSYDGTCLYSQLKSELIGTNILDEVDEMGNKLTQLELESIQNQDTATIYCRHPKKAYQAKAISVRRYDEFQCYVSYTYFSDRVIDQLAAVENIRARDLLHPYGGYNFIMKPDGTNIMWDREKYTPEKEENLLRSSNPILRRAALEIIKEVNKNPDGCHIQYEYKNNVHGEYGEYTTFAYVRYYPECDWIIVSGFDYLEVQKEFMEKKKEFRASIVRNVIWVLLFIVLIVVFEYVAMQKYLRKIAEDLGLVGKFLQKDTLADSVSADQFHFEEGYSIAARLSNANKSLDTTIKKLELEQRKSQESDRLKSAFLANLSHEVLTPMNSIVGFSTILADCDDDLKDEVLEMIQQSSRELFSLIESVMEVAKMESVVTEIANKPVRLGNVFNDARKSFLAEKKRNGKNLNYELKSNLGDGLVFMGDEGYIGKVLELLLSNAVKFTTKGTITLGAEVDSGEIHFSVKDTGVGIAEDEFEIIFNRFTQGGTLENQLSRDYRGVGIGLTLARNIVECMGGEIWVKSKEGEGSIFYFSLPFIVHGR
ncbi:MAG: ATP-binding protein [Mangrovibacterium sp.]